MNLVRLKNNIYALLIIALVLRLIALSLSSELFKGDAVLYYKISENLIMPENNFGFTNWFDWSPIHVLFLYLTNQSLVAQIIISLITLIILNKVNYKLAWFWALYPAAILYSASYFKENLLFLFIAIILYLYTVNKYSLLLIFPVMLLFTGNSYTYNTINGGYMYNFWELWKPDFNIVTYFGDYWNYILAIPYAVLIMNYLRNTKIDLTFIVIALYTFTFSLMYGNSRFREPLMILIINKVLIRGKYDT